MNITKRWGGGIPVYINEKFQIVTGHMIETECWEKNNEQVLLSIERQKKVWRGDVYTILGTSARKMSSAHDLFVVFLQRKEKYCLLYFNYIINVTHELYSLSYISV